VLLVISDTKKRLDEFESMPEYRTGIWYSPYVKIYSIGGRNRIAEISNYPRAYKDTAKHIYTEDIEFIVSKRDLNIVEDGKRFYEDSKGKLFNIGDKAIRWAGDQLPDSFPLWITSESLPYTQDLVNYKFDLSQIPGFPRSGYFIFEVYSWNENSYQQISSQVLNSIKSQASSKKIILKRKPREGDKQILRIRYRRSK